MQGGGGGRPDEKHVWERWRSEKKPVWIKAGLGGGKGHLSGKRERSFRWGSLEAKKKISILSRGH